MLQCLIRYSIESLFIEKFINDVLYFILQFWKWEWRPWSYKYIWEMLGSKQDYGSKALFATVNYANIKRRQKWSILIIRKIDQKLVYSEKVN